MVTGALDAAFAAPDPSVGPNFSFDVEALFAPLRGTGWRFRLSALLLAMIAGWGAFAYVLQLRDGLALTGMGRPAYWGIYMVNFVFFTGISMAGTLISAILRVAHAEWRRPITRSAEVITVLGLIFGASFIIIDMGRPDRLLNVLRFGRVESPILWDVVCVTTYLTSSVIYLYLPMIPDMAILRDARVGRVWLYRALALGYRGTAAQHRRIERWISVMAVAIMPTAVSVHTVVSYIFATTLQPGWHSTAFGPLFVAGALFSGIGALLVAMAIIRRAYGLQGILRDVHFANLGMVFLPVAGLMIYLTFNDFLVEITGNEPDVMAPVLSKIQGAYAAPFWVMVALGFVVPAAVLAFPKGRTLPGLVTSGVLVVAGMWIERYILIVPTLDHPRLPWGHAGYRVTWVELSVTVGAMAAFALLYMLFTRLFPIVSIWEVQEGVEHALPEVKKRLESYLPS